MNPELAAEIAQTTQSQNICNYDNHYGKKEKELNDDSLRSAP
jgi:hypothetical protein